MRGCSRQHSALWNTSHTWLPILTASLFILLYRFDYLVSLENLCEPLFSILWVRGQEPGDIQPGCRLPEARVARYQFARAGSQQPGPRCVGHKAEGKDMEFMYLMNSVKPRWTCSCFEVFRQNQRSGEGHRGHTRSDPLRVAPYHEKWKMALAIAVAYFSSLRNTSGAHRSFSQILSTVFITDSIELWVCMTGHALVFVFVTDQGR